MRLTRLACRACTALAMARYVLPVPAGPIPNTTVLASIASTYSFWPTDLGLMVRPRLDRMFIVSTSAGRSTVAAVRMEMARFPGSAVSGWDRWGEVGVWLCRRLVWRDV